MCYEIYKDSGMSDRLSDVSKEIKEAWDAITQDALDGYKKSRTTSVKQTAKSEPWQQRQPHNPRK